MIAHPHLDKSDLGATIREALGAVRYPPYSRDIVSFGLVKEVRTTNGTVTVELEANPKDAETGILIQAQSEQVLKALPQLNGLQVKVEITGGSAPQARTSRGDESPLSPLQGEVREEGGTFDPDPLITAMARPDLAPGAGYGEDGPTPLGGPMGDRNSTKWQGPPPVFQWEIDPSAPERQAYGEHELEREGWVFRLWWQTHPAGLVYASISAIAEEEEAPPAARRHPVGRNVAVNLVYDLRREGVVAIYGTALDFRPFVEVFLASFDLKTITDAGGASPAKENHL